MRPSRILPLFSIALLCGSALAAAATWTVPGDYPTIQEALDAPEVADGDVIAVAAGSHAGAYVSKSVALVGDEGAWIDDGPLHPAGLTMGFRLLAGSDGARIEGFAFTVDLAIMNGDGVHGVTVTHATFWNVIQGISNWRGNDWVITHNQFQDMRTANGGGIAILVGEFSGGSISGSLVAFNSVTGTLHVDPADGGGYAGSGVVIYTDYRWGRTGGEVSDTIVTHNRIDIESDSPEVVDMVGLELTDTRDDDALGCSSIHDNVVVKNIVKKMANDLALTPASLDDCNEVGKNVRAKARRLGALPLGS